MSNIRKDFITDFDRYGMLANIEKGIPIFRMENPAIWDDKKKPYCGCE